MTVQKPRPAGSFAEALGRTIAFHGGLEASSKLTRIGVSALHIHADPDTRELRCPLDVLLALEAAKVAAGGRPDVTEWLAALHGFALVRLAAARGGSLQADLTRVARETGEATVAGLEALRDGKVDEAERRAWLAEVEEAMAALGDLRARLMQPGEQERAGEQEPTCGQDRAGEISPPVVDTAASGPRVQVVRGVGA